VRAIDRRREAAETRRFPFCSGLTGGSDHDEPAGRHLASFSFVHAADLHLGSPLAGLAARDPAMAERFGDATRQAVASLVTRTIELGARFLVIAGDVYDGPWPDNSVGLFFNREMARLGRASIPVFVLRGNHDAESVVTKSVTLPDNVASFDTRKPQTHVIGDLRVALHGQGFADRQVTDNLALSYPPALAGHLNIGVLHTSLTGRPPHADYAPCSLNDLLSKGYDYWALGHVHAHEIVHADPPVVFPGNIQGRSIRETGAKGAVLVHVEEGAVAGIERLIVDEARFARVEVDVSTASDLPALLRAAESAIGEALQAGEGRPLALRVRLSGRTSLQGWGIANRATLTDEIVNLCGHLATEAWLEKLQLDLRPEGEIAPLVAGDAALDLSALIEEASGDEELRAEAQRQLALLAGKLAGLVDPAAPFGEDLDTLLAEARLLLAERIAEGGHA
jgi:DNA repair protein SbcD/Mre11